MNGKDIPETNAADGWALVYYYYYKQQIAFSLPYSHKLCHASAMQVLLGEWHSHLTLQIILLDRNV